MQIVRQMFGAKRGFDCHHAAANINANSGRHDCTLAGNDAADGRAHAPMHIRHCCNMLVDEWQLGRIVKLCHSLIFDLDALGPCLDRRFACAGHGS